MKIAIILLLLLFTAGCGYNQKSCQMDAKWCPNNRTVGRVGPNCEFTPCELPTSLDECNSKDGFWRDWCYSDYASEVTIDPLVCNEIKNREARNMCYRKISNVATDIQTCNNLKKFKQECVVTISRKSHDSNICKDLSGTNKAKCYSFIGSNTLNSNLCEKAKDYFIGSMDLKFLCLHEIAKAKNETSFCENLEEIGYTDPYYKDFCLQGFGIYLD